MDQRRWAQKLLICLLGLGFVLSYVTYMVREARGDPRPTNPDIGSNTIELLSYRASRYTYQIVRSSEPLPSGFEQRDFDDTDFLPGSAAFGGGGGGAIDGGDCPLRLRVQTEWPLGTQLLVRRLVDIPAGATKVRVMVSVDNDIVGVFFNGMRLPEHTLGTESIVHNECPIQDEFRFDVPQNVVQPGENLVAFHIVDRLPIEGRPNESFFDARIFAESPTPPPFTVRWEEPQLGREPQVIITLAREISDEEAVTFDATARASESSADVLITAAITQADTPLLTIETMQKPQTPDVPLKVHFGAAFSGIKEGNFTWNGEILEGEIDGQQIMPVRVAPGLITAPPIMFADGQPLPVQNSPESREALNIIAIELKQQSPVIAARVERRCSDICRERACDQCQRRFGSKWEPKALDGTGGCTCGQRMGQVQRYEACGLCYWEEFSACYEDRCALGPGILDIGLNFLGPLGDAVSVIKTIFEDF